MVKKTPRQGDIIKINFNPQIGHEQAGYRPAVVISNDFFLQKAKMAIVCPITSKSKPSPARVQLDDRTTTTGLVLCDHVRSLDIITRGYQIVESIPADILHDIIDIVYGEIEI